MSDEESEVSESVLDRRAAQARLRESNRNRSDEQVKEDQERLHPDGKKKCSKCRHQLP